MARALVAQAVHELVARSAQFMFPATGSSTTAAICAVLREGVLHLLRIVVFEHSVCR
jgi:hypothetical protein